MLQKATIKVIRPITCSRRLSLSQVKLSSLQNYFLFTEALGVNLRYLNLKPRNGENLAQSRLA